MLSNEIHEIYGATGNHDDEEDCKMISRKFNHDDELRIVEDVDSPPPRDRCYSVYFIFIFLGIACLLPWNFFITAKRYFQYKLRNTSIPTTADYDDSKNPSEIQLLFLSYLSTSSTIANLLCLCFTVVIIRCISLNKRVISSLILIVIVFGATAALVKIDTDGWQMTFFVLTIVSAAIINGSTAVLTGSIFGLVCRFPPLYTQSLMTGQAVGGTFAALAGIFSLLGGSSVIDSAFGYFLTATVISIVALAAYCLLYTFDFSKYYIEDSGEDRRSLQTSDNAHYIQLLGHFEFYTVIVKKIWKQGLGVCLVFSVTLSLFPAICSSIQAQHYDKNDTWTAKFFTPVVCFLFFNLGDWVGRPISGWIKQPSYRHENILLLFCVLRVVFIPLMLQCNVVPRTLPVWFSSDAYPIAFIILLGITNGYFSTLNMMYAPQRVPLHQAEGAGVLMSLMLVLGLAVGSGLSFLFVKLIKM